jgi:hypothetical protein
LKDPIPNTSHLMIIGAMKAGTTSLFDMLQHHPEICPSKVKEPEFFSKKQRHDLKVLDYSELFDFDPSIHKYAMEGSTGYTKYPKMANVPERIEQSGLQPKFIYIVRHPIKRIVSNLNFWKNHPNWSDPMSNLDHMIDISKYHLQLSQYTTYFPKESILILDFDELISNRDETLQTVYSFLGISKEFKKEFTGKSNVTVVKGGLELYLRKHFSKWFKYIPEGLKVKTRESIVKNAKSVPLTLEGSELHRAQQALKDDMQAFGKEYGFNVSKWGF